MGRLSDYYLGEVERVAQERIRDSAGAPGYIAFEGDEDRENERMGAAGEIFLAGFFGIPHNAKSNPKGDGGKDDRYLLRTPDGPREFKIDVKANSWPVKSTSLLMVPVGLVRADIYVLAQYDRATSLITDLLGWQWAETLVKHGKKVRRRKFNYEMPQPELRVMEELKVRFIGRCDR